MGFQKRFLWKYSEDQEKSWLELVYQLWSVVIPWDTDEDSEDPF